MRSGGQEGDMEFGPTQVVTGRNALDVRTEHFQSTTTPLADVCIAGATTDAIQAWGYLRGGIFFEDTDTFSTDDGEVARWGVQSGGGTVCLFRDLYRLDWDWTAEGEKEEIVSAFRFHQWSPAYWRPEYVAAIKDFRKTALLLVERMPHTGEANRGTILKEITNYAELRRESDFSQQDAARKLLEIFAKVGDHVTWTNLSGLSADDDFMTPLVAARSFMSSAELLSVDPSKKPQAITALNAAEEQIRKSLKRDPNGQLAWQLFDELVALRQGIEHPAPPPSAPEPVAPPPPAEPSRPRTKRTARPEAEKSCCPRPTPTQLQLMVEDGTWDACKTNLCK